MAEKQTEEKKKPGRPKKVKAEPKQVVSEEKEVLLMKQNKENITMQNVQDDLRQLYGKLLGAANFTGFELLNPANVYNPFLQNQRLKSINTPPMSCSKEELNSMLESPQHKEEPLRGIGWELSSKQNLYYQILRLSSDIPMYNWYKTPPLLKEEEYRKKDFINEDKFVDDWISTFNPKMTFKRIGMEVKRDGKSTYLFRNSIKENQDGSREVNYCTFQKLPSRYVKLTAIGMYGYIASFDMMIFMNPAFNVEQYPDFIKRIWEEMLEKEVVKADPFKHYTVDVNKLNNYTYVDENGIRRNGVIENVADTYLYWVQLPQEICYTFSSDNSHPWVAPDTMGLFLGLQDLADYNTLSSLVASTPLTMLLTGEAETVNDPNAGRDQTVINPNTIAAFQNNFNAKTSTNVEAIFLPFKNLKLQSVNTSLHGLDISSDALKNFISSAGEGGVIVATDKPSVAQVKGAQLLEEAKYDYVTIQFESVLNMIINKLLGCTYQWKVHLWGGIFSFDTDLKRTKELFVGGAKFLLPRIASAYGLTVRDVKANDNYINSLGVYDEFSTMTNSKSDETAKSGGTGKVGRPSMDDNDVENDNTAASKDAGTNTVDMRDYVLKNAESGTCIICGESTEDGEILCEQCKEAYYLEGVES